MKQIRPAIVGTSFRFPQSDDLLQPLEDQLVELDAPAQLAGALLGAKVLVVQLKIEKVVDAACYDSFFSTDIC